MEGDKLLLVLAAGVGLTYAAQGYLTTPYDAVFDRVSSETGVPGNLLRAICRNESSFRNIDSKPNTNGTVDHGLMQINDRTASHYGVTLAQLKDPYTNVRTAARLLVDIRKELLARGRFSPFTWPMAYNVGSDLEPRTIGIAYAQKVVWHWTLYDIARIAA